MSKQASDFYFFYSQRDSSFWIVDKEYWHNEGGINDTSFDGALDAFLPIGFREVGESCFHYYANSGMGSWDDGRRLLTEAGFTEMDDPEK